MLPEDDDAPPLYDGPICIIRPDGILFTVEIEPPLPCGEGAPQTYASKIGAWGQMLAWCEQYRLPVRDQTNPKFGSRN